MKLLRDPLFHFSVLGLALLAIYLVAEDRLRTDPDRVIEIGVDEISFLAEAFEQRWHRPPTVDELRGMVDSRLREEVLYRQALAVGLDRNDVVVRRRMVQKMEMLSQDLMLLADPGDEELRRFFEERQADYRMPPRITFLHVYFNADRRGDIEADARRILEELRGDSLSPEEALDRGDRFLLEYDFSLATPLEVRRAFGSRFADEVFLLEPGWQGPVASGYGLHLVQIRQRVEGRDRELEEIRDRVIGDFNRDRTERAQQALFEGLADAYRIVIDEAAIESLAVAGPEAD